MKTAAIQCLLGALRLPDGPDQTRERTHEELLMLLRDVNFLYPLNPRTVSSTAAVQYALSTRLILTLSRASSIDQSLFPGLVSATSSRPHSSSRSNG